jgi:hypothetical protein
MPTPKPNPKPSLGIDRRHRALALLAGSPDGMTESFLLAHGFTTKLMAELVSDGLVTARAEWMRVRRREIEVTRVRITPAGERALYSLKRK